jgi:acyl-CoA synthetase (AMP-forming)/AMP-acid ligase II
VTPAGALAGLLPEPGDQLAVHVNGQDVSRTTVRSLASAVGDALRDAGVGPGAPVGVLLPDGAELVASLFGVWRAEGVYIPLNPRLPDTELARVTDTVRPTAYVTTAANAARVRGSGDPVRVGDPDGGDHLSVVVVPADGEARHDPGVALVSFTSGTTGRPKPVPLTHERVLSLLDGVVGSMRRKATDKPPMPNLVPVSLALWAGIYQVLFAFRVGAPLVLMDGFDTRRFAELVDRFEIRSTVLPPAAMVMLADDEAVTDLTPLRYVRSISSPLSPLQARRFADRFGVGVLNCYGQTELGGEVVGWTVADLKAHGDKLGAAGRPHAGVEVRTDEGGELWVRTGRLPHAAAADLGDRLTPDGWVRTGDIATIDEDGFVWIEGRASDMVNRGGLKVHPGEVEEVLRAVPGVADAAVAGVPDDRLGEVPVAWCVPDDPAAGLPADEVLVAACREHLVPYKVPVRFEAVAGLPRNGVGKVLKTELVAGLRA